MDAGYFVILGIVAVFFIVVYFSFKEDVPPYMGRKQTHDDRKSVRENMMIRERERKKEHGRMPGSFGRYGYDITNPIPVSDLGEYLKSIIYHGHDVTMYYGDDAYLIEDMAQMCFYEVSLFKGVICHVALKIKGRPLPVLLFFIDGEKNSAYCPRGFFNLKNYRFVKGLLADGIKPQIRDNKDERLFMDEEEKAHDFYEIKSVTRLNTSDVGERWKNFINSYKTVGELEDDSKKIMENPDEFLDNLMSPIFNELDPKPKCPVQEVGESDEAYTKRVNEYVKADTEWRKRNQGKK